MPFFRVELREARPINGHTGEAPITTVHTVEATDWEQARICSARRHGIDVHDPAMIATETTPPAAVKEDAAPVSEKVPRSKRGSKR